MDLIDRHGAMQPVRLRPGLQPRLIVPTVGGWLAHDACGVRPLLEGGRIGVDLDVHISVPVAQLTRYQNLIGTGELNQHSFYYYVPGFLKAGLDMEALVALVAPRRQVILAGGSDPLSPPDGIPIITDFTRAVYRLYGAEDHFQPHIYPELDHVYTVEMFTTLLDYLEQHL